MAQNRPILSILSSVSKSFSECLAEAKCPIHQRVDLPCRQCEEDDFIEKKQRRQQEMLELQSKEQHRKDYPEKWLATIGVPNRYLSSSFDCFEGGNALVALCKDLVLEPFSLLLWGGPGSGKTHLSVSTLRERVKEGMTDDVFVCEQDLLRDIRKGYAQGISEDEALKKYLNCALLVYDDLGAEKATDWVISTVNLIVDRRYRDVFPMVITTNLKPEQIEERFGERIASRLAVMKNVHVQLPDRRKKR